MTLHPIGRLERKRRVCLEGEIRVKSGAWRPINAMERPALRQGGADRGSRGMSQPANAQVKPRWKIHSAHRRFI